MRVLIAGCGYVGTALGRQLSDDGHDVWGIRRDPTGLPSAIAPIAADLTAADTLRGLPSDLDAVVIAVSADRREPGAYRHAYVDGCATLLRVLADDGQPVQRVLFTSSTAVYGGQDGGWVDEDSPTDPDSATGAIMVEAERTVLGGPFPATVVRFGGIYGPGRTRLLDRVRRGEATCPPEPSYTNRIHRDDCSGTLRHLLGLAAPDHVYVGVDEDPAERCTVLRWLAEATGSPPPEVDPVGGPHRGSKRCRGDRLRASGYRFRYPSFRDGYAEMIAAG